MGSLHDPERCPACKARVKVVESRHQGLYRRRRKKCETCGYAWSTYESTINIEPTIDRFLRRKRRGEVATPPDPPVAPSTTSAPAPPPPPAPPVATGARGRRVSRSSYLR